MCTFRSKIIPKSINSYFSENLDFKKYNTFWYNFRPKSINNMYFSGFCKNDKFELFGLNLYFLV